MNDTHGETGKGWYGFDLDGTLAKYDGWKGIDSIGAPVVPMVKLIRRMHDAGEVVKIMTARIAPKEKPETKPNPYRIGKYCIQEPDVQTWAFKDEWTPLEFVQEWCYRVLGFVPEIVYQKDHLMLELYDDRVKQVEPNTGVVIADRCAELEKKLEQKEVETHVVRTVERVDLRWASRMLYLFVGLTIGWFLFLGLQYWLTVNAIPQRERELHDALGKYLEASKTAAVIDAAKGACGWTR